MSTQKCLISQSKIYIDALGARTYHAGMKHPQNMLSDLCLLGFTQADISMETGIPQATISRILNGVHADPKFSSAHAISMMYDRVLRSVKRRAA